MQRRWTCQSWNKLLVAATGLALGTGIALAASTASAVTSGGSVTEIALDRGKVDTAFTPRRLALLVGVRSFQDERYRSLVYPEKDVADLTTFLRTHNRVDGDIELVLTGDDATTTRLDAALDEIEKKNTSADDIVLVYVSTHGTLAYESARKLKRYAVMRDTAFDRVPETGVPLDYLETRLARLKSTRKALILALCHSGSGKSQLPGALQDELSSMKAEFFPQPLHEVSSAMMVLAASAWGQPAREDQRLGNDIYTHFLLQGLSQNDANQDGAISLFEAHEYARTRTYDYTRGQQTPTALVNLQGTDPIILNGQPKRRSEPMIFADSDRFRDVKLLVNGEAKGTLWQPQTVPPGRVRLTLLDPRAPDAPLLDHQVYMTSGKSYPVSQLFARPPSLSAEARVYNLPLPVGLDGGKRAQLWAPGLGIRSSELLGTRLTAGMAWHALSRNGQTSLDDDESDVAWHAQLLQVAAGIAFFPAANVSLSAGGGIEHLELSRTVANPAVARPSQSARITYPILSGEARLLNLLDAIYAGAQLTLLPDRRNGIEMNEQRHRLAPLSGGLLLGYAF